jgi:hypothetical protein
MNDNYELAPDVLRGADEIACFLFGDPKPPTSVSPG